MFRYQSPKDAEFERKHPLIACIITCMDRSEFYGQQDMVWRWRITFGVFFLLLFVAIVVPSCS